MLTKRLTFIKKDAKLLASFSETSASDILQQIANNLQINKVALIACKIAQSI